MKDKTLVVMAAGMGSRFGGFKQVEPVGPNGEFIIDYSVYDAKRAGFNKIVFVITKELESVFKKTIGKRVEDKIQVSYAFQEISDIPEKQYLAQKRVKPWGTVQAVLSAKNQVEGDFLVINADDFYGFDSFLKASQFLDDNKEENVYASVSFPYYVTASKFGSVKRGISFSNNDMIREIIEAKVVTKGDFATCYPLDGAMEFSVSLDQPVAVNMFAFKNNFFDHLEEYFKEFFHKPDEVILKSEALLADVIKEKLLNREIVLKNLVSNSKWMGMTYKEELNEVKNSIAALIEKGEYPESLWG